MRRTTSSLRVVNSEGVIRAYNVDENSHDTGRVKNRAAGWDT